MKYKVGTQMFSKKGDERYSFIITKINYEDGVYHVKSLKDGQTWWITESTVESYNLKLPKKNRLPIWF